MTSFDERAPLLTSRSSTAGSSVRESDRESENGSDEDAVIDEQPLDILPVKYGTSLGSLGLDGGSQGTTFLRRGSVSYVPPPSARRPSRLSVSEPNTVSEVFDSRSSVVSFSGEPSTNPEVGATVSKPPKFLGGVSEAQFWALFSCILLVQFVACFDSTLMASSHPVITSYFNSSNSASWLSTSFLLTSTAFQPLFGRISDTFGRKGPYLFSIAVFVIGTAWCAIAQSMLSFILARAFCGIGAGGAMSMGAIINSDLVPIETRGIYQSIMNLAFGVGASLGAALGGFLADALGWRWEFGIQGPPLILCLIFAYVTTPDNLGPQLAKHSKIGLWDTLKAFDLAGSFFLTASVALLILAMSLGGNVLPWSHPVIIISLVLFIISAVVLIKVERTAKRPVMPLNFMFDSPRNCLIFSNFFANMSMNAILFNLPLFFQAVLLDSATNSGARLILPFIFSMLSAFTTGFIITWTQNLKPTMVLGYILILAGSILLTTMKKGLPNWLYTLYAVPSSLGQGFCFPSVLLSVLATSHQDDMAVATSVLILWRSLGTVLGVAVSSLIVQNTLAYYLRLFVTGPDKDAIISEARKSVDSISRLPPIAQGEVIDAYASALRLTFISAVATAVIALILILPLRLPKLGRGKAAPTTASASAE